MIRKYPIGLQRFEPNAAHHYLKKLEPQYEVVIVAQNVK